MLTHQTGHVVPGASPLEGAQPELRYALQKQLSNPTSVWYELVSWFLTFRVLWG